MHRPLAPIYQYRGYLLRSPLSLGIAWFRPCNQVIRLVAYLGHILTHLQQKTNIMIFNLLAFQAISCCAISSQIYWLDEVILALQNKTSNPYNIVVFIFIILDNKV